MKYKFLLLDIDDTVLDFKSAEDYAFNKTHRDNNVDYTEEDFSLYKSINGKLWRDFENGKIKIEQIIEQRFAVYLNERNLPEINADKFQKDYENNLADNATIIDSTIIPTLKYIHSKAKIYSVTNGIEHIQVKRLNNCGLSRYFSGYFISQAIGYSKPDKKFFEYVEHNITNFNKKEALLVGDSMTADIPAANFGFDTCLINRSGKNIDSYAIQPKYQITEFSELTNYF